MEIAYASSKFRATYYRRSHHTLCITPKYFEGGKTGFLGDNVGKIFESLGMSQLVIESSRNDWYLNDQLPDLLNTISKISHTYTRRIAYGASMGGYFAILVSGAAKADRIVAISPQYSIDPQKVPFETRWRTEAADVDFRHDDLQRMARRDTQGIIVYDPFVSLDKAQTFHIRNAFPSWSYIPFSFGGHPATQMIRKERSLGNFAREALAGEALPHELLQPHRLARETSPLFWLGVANQMKDNRPALARSAIDRVLADPRLSPRKTFSAGKIAAELGNADGIKLMERALGATQNPPQWWKVQFKRMKRQLDDIASGQPRAEFADRPPISTSTKNYVDPEIQAADILGLNLSLGSDQ